MRYKTVHWFGLVMLLAFLASMAAADSDPHAAHRRAAMEADYRVTRHDYALPGVTLTDQTGRTVQLPDVLDQVERTVISFIFTSCAGICPMITANMTRAVPSLDRIDDDYQVLLITVDPQYDTPERLAEYGRRFGAGDRIRFLTGTGDAVFDVLRSLDVLYEGSNKMNHQPVTLMVSHQAPDWVRIDGLIGSEVLVEQYRSFFGQTLAAHHE